MTPLLDLQDFTNATIFDDVLHVAHRGFVPDLLASGILDIFGTSGTHAAFELATKWSKAGAGRSRELSLDEINIGYENNYPTLYAKGADCKQLVFWFAAWTLRRLLYILFCACVSPG